MAGPDQREADVVGGGGAAGLSAALVLARARRHVVLVDAGSPRNARAHGEGLEATLEDGTAVPLGGLFVSPRFELDLRSLAQLQPETVETPLGTAMSTDSEGRTSVPGLWAAADRDKGSYQATVMSSIVTRKPTR